MPASQGPRDGRAGPAEQSGTGGIAADPRAEFFEPILAACAPIAELETALDAELAVSALLGGAYAAADTDRDAAVGRFADDVVSVLTGRSDRLAGALLAALAGVA
ncbi:MAG: hypothetical protein WCA46_17885, partial [Actinocatenispora sp.]